MRRAKPEKREILPDVRYKSINLQTLMQHVLKQGKKSVAAGLVYDAMELINERTGKNAIDVFDTALKNVSPVMEVRPRRVGGATYQVPMEVSSDRRTTLAIRWILSAARDRSGNVMPILLFKTCASVRCYRSCPSGYDSVVLLDYRRLDW